jgi:hypothetical protein
MTVLTVRRPRLQISDTSSRRLSWLFAASLDSTAVADAVAGMGWSVHHHEAPDYEVSLMILPEDDDRRSTFVISVAGAHLCLDEVRDDALRSLGRFATLEDTITKLRRAMAEQADA